MTPQNGYIILIQFDKRTEEVRGGIIVPISVIEDSDVTGHAIIHAVSAGSKYKVGQVIVFSKFVPINFRLKDKEFLAIKESDVIAIIPDYDKDFSLEKR